MNRLSLRAAMRCETAKSSRCRCRCGGLLHGAGRGADASYFATLPKEDPHYALAKQSKPRRRKAKALPLFDQLGETA